MKASQMNTEVEPEPENRLVAYQPPQSPSLFGTADPAEIVAAAAKVANVLKQVIVSKGLVSKISGREYPRCEAWTLLGTMLGVFPVTVWTRRIADGWEARTEARTKDGAIVGAAEAMCLRSERNWANRDEFALRSMAATRSVAKALRMPLGFVMSLSGFEATPAEEMIHDDPPERHAKPARPQTAAEVATEEQRARWIKTLRPLGQGALDYAYGAGWLRPPTGDDPGEPIEALSIHRVPTTKLAATALLAKIQRFMDAPRGEPQEEPEGGAQ